MNFYAQQPKQKLVCILEAALMFKILLNTFYLCHAPNGNEGYEIGRFMIEISGFSDLKRPLIFNVTCDVIIEGRKSEK